MQTQFEKRLLRRIEQERLNYELVKLGIKEKIRQETESGTLDGEKMKTYGKHLKKFEAEVSFAEVRYAQYRRAQALKKREKQRGDEE